MKPCYTETITTERLTLRRFRENDAQGMYANWASDPEVTKYLTWPTHKSVEVSAFVLHDWCSHYAEENYLQWAIVPRGMDEPIGAISVVKVEPEIESMEVGYCIGRAWWGKGIMTEALTAVRDYLFETAEILRLTAGHDSKNPASGRVMAKAGLSHEASLRQAGRNNTGICDMEIYCMLRREWEALRK